MHPTPADASGLWTVAPESALPLYTGFIVWDEAWSAQHLFSGDRTAREALVELEPVVRRFVGAIAATPESVRVMPASQQPMLIHYDELRTTVQINPDMLALLAYEARARDRRASPPPSRTPTTAAASTCCRR